MDAGALSMLTKYVWGFVLLSVIAIIWYYRKQMSKKNSNIDKMKVEYSSSDYAPKLSSVDANDAKFKDVLINYYIACSYNSCCAGDFQDSYVSLDPLEQVIKQGARVLDFAIYSVDGNTVVAASPEPSYNIKGTYNSLPVDTVLTTVARRAFSSGTCPNAGDPLFLHFRIKSNLLKIYDTLNASVKSNFKTRLLDASWGYEGRPNSAAGSRNLCLESPADLAGKVIIICSQDSNNFRETPFYELVNLSNSGVYFRTMRNHDIQYTINPQELKNDNRTTMTMTLPDWSEINTNVPAILHFQYGCQMIGMNYQNLDKNMNYYFDMFNEAGSAFILKPEYLRYVPTTIPPPPPANPCVSYAPRTLNLPMYSTQI